MTAETLKNTAAISLSVPAAGKDGPVDNLVMHRPKARHVKQLVAILGPDFVRSIMKADGPATPDDGTASSRDMIGEALAMLADPSRLDGASALIADLCKVDVQTIDDIDPVDFPKFGKALADFFPALQSVVSTSL